MNTLQIRGNWNIAKGRMKQKLAQLTDDDLEYFEGQQDELIGRIQKRSRKTRKEIEGALEGRCGCEATPEDEHARKGSNQGQEKGTE